MIGSILNSHTGNTFAQAVILLNAIGAGCACWYNVFAARRVLVPFLARIHAAVASLAAVFAAAYMFLLWSDVTVPAFSSFVRGVGLLSWPLVWVGPAYLHARPQRLVQVIADKIVDEVTKELSP